MKEVPKEVAEKMANWWAEQITNPMQNAGSTKQGGNDMINLLGTLLSEKSIPNIEQIDIFKSKLTEIIIKNGVYNLVVDYYPDDYLSEAAEYSGINTNCFPWKSETIIRDGRVLAKRGYGERLERI